VNLNQLGIAAGAETKWLLNSSALLGRSLTPTRSNARWWGLVKLLEQAFDLPLAVAAKAATRALAERNDGGRAGALEDPSASACMTVDLSRYDSILLARLSRARVRETPKRRGRRALNPDPVAAAAAYGIDIGLIRSSLARTPGERLAMLDQNARFLRHIGRRAG